MAKNKTTIKYKSDFRPDTQVDQIYNKETGLWEVSGAKPKSTPVKQTTKSNKVEPIYVDNPKDKRLQAYNDSLNLFNKSKINDKLMSSGEYSPSEWLDYINGKINIEGNNGLSLSKSWEALKKYNGIGPTPIKVNSYLNDDIHVNMFKKPVQPVILKKEVKVPVPKVNYLKNLPTEQDSKIDILGNNVQYQNEPTQETTKGKPLNDFLIQTVKTPNGMKTYIRKDRNSPWIEQYKYGGKIKKLTGGGIIGADGKSETQPQGMGAGAITGIVGNALDTVGNFIPVDNDGRGVSKKGQKISDGVQTGLGAVSDIASNFGPVGQMVAGATKIGSFLVKGFTAIADAIKEKKHPTDELVNETYSPTYKDSSMSFGSLNTLNQMALGGQTQSTTDNFKQYEAPSHENGGQMIDANNNPTKQPQKAVAEIEKKENSYKNYVFSHELGFAKLAEKINKKYKDREDPISKNSLDIELTELMKKNEKVKQQIQQSQQLAQAVLEYGGVIPKADLGLKLLDDLTNVNKDKTELGEYMADNNGVSPPIPNKDFSKLNIPSNSTFNLGEVPVLPSDTGEGDLPEAEKTRKQFSPEAISGFSIKGLEMAAHLAQILKKPDYVKPVYNPEENTIKNKMANRKVDNQAIIDAINLEENASKQNLADNSSSVGVQNANMQKLHANAINSIAKTKIEEQQLNNQYRGEEANMLNTLGTQKMQAQVYAEDVNAKSKANVQMQRDKFLKESIGGLGDYLLKKDDVNKENNFQMNILKSKGINFTPTDYKDWNKAGVDIAKFTGELESETDTAKRKAKMEEVHQKFLAKGGTEEDWQSNSIAQGLTNKYLK